MVANWKSNASVKYNYNNQIKFLLSNDFVGSRYRIGDEIVVDDLVVINL